MYQVLLCSSLSAPSLFTSFKCYGHKEESKTVINSAFFGIQNTKMFVTLRQKILHSVLLFHRAFIQQFVKQCSSGGDWFQMKQGQVETVTMTFIGGNA